MGQTASTYSETNKLHQNSNCSLHLRTWITTENGSYSTN